MTAAQTATATPVADAYVDAGHPTNKYGTKTDLKADTIPLKRTFIRFNVQGVSGTVTRATLRLYSKKATTVGFDVRDVADDTWGETTITHNTAPTPSATVTALLRAVRLERVRLRRRHAARPGQRARELRRDEHEHERGEVLQPRARRE